ncbi:hypothetical protein MLD38_022388 [Melastoma candidum]|uniref:Uncharacterized protein n=1 Tax=Melastoma candidum TaxID=119954 RepID=A0ACB9QS82_9MYRT|nr:hypothetical protein MLD38_022388 [Melastoma candidum]
MGVGWRTAFCTASPGQSSRGGDYEDDSEEEQRRISPSGIKSCVSFRFFSSASTTPRSFSDGASPTSRAINEAQDVEPMLLNCRTVSALPGSHSYPSSHRSWPKVDFRKSGFKSVGNDCGIYTNSIRTGKKSPASASSASRCYDDDESLTSPGFWGSKFYTIPEECEEEGEGFKEVGNASDETCERSGRVRVDILPERAVISSNRSYETHVALLSVKGEPLQFGGLQRAPVDLVVVLDLNCDASGEKLEIIKANMNVVISSLRSSDRLSIVAFAENSKRILALKRMTARGRRIARVLVNRLVCGTQRGSCVGEALRKASKVLEDRSEQNLMSCVIFLSDIRKDALRVVDFGSKTRFVHVEISREWGSRFSEDLFAKSLAGILNVVARALKIDLQFVDSVRCAEIVAVYSRDRGQCTLLGSRTVWLGDLYAEEERELLVEMRIPYLAASSNHVIKVHCRYNDLAGNEVAHWEDQKVSVYRPRVAERYLKAGSEWLRNVFITTRAIAESKRSIDRGDCGGAHRLIASARALMIQSRSQSGDECLKTLEAELIEIPRQKQKKMEMKLTPRQKQVKDERAEALTPPKSWQAAEKLADVAMMKRSLNRVRDLHGFELAGF